MRAILILAAAAATLSGCASQGGSIPGYNDDLRRLEQDCAARGGILTATGVQTDRPQTDNVCKITGGQSGRIPPSN